MSILRSRFSVQDGCRFLSHLDTLKAMERALRRAGLPVVFSQGFNPHPQMAFGPARAVGLASLSEYFDVELSENMLPEIFRERLGAQLPLGFKLLETREVPVGIKALMAVLNCAVYQVHLDCPAMISQTELDQRTAAVFSQEAIVVVRHSPKGIKRSDIRPGIWQLSAQADSSGILVKMEVRLGGEGNVRPTEVVEALGLLDCQIVETLRTGLFVRQTDGGKADPWKSL